VVGATALGVLAWGIGTGVEVPGAERREDANLIATRGAAPVRRWIVAHVDTKAQGHSMAGRLVSIWTLVVALTGLTLLAGTRAVTGAPLPTIPVAAVAGLALAAGALAARGRPRGTSAGARDNGTGVLAALTAAGLIHDPEIGFLLTGAEEFGLVGARAAVRSGALGHDAEVINLDTLDQEGPLYLVYHDSQGAGLARRLHPLLGSVVPRTVSRRLPLGILTDSLPLARAGMAAVTLSRLNWTTLRLMHTPQDLSQGLDTLTAEAVGRALAGAGGERLRAVPGPPSGPSGPQRR
jgi:Peptidase family M28